MPKESKNKKEKKHFFKDLKAELKKVIWPTPKQLVNNTVAVITIVLITALIVFALDFAFEQMNTYGINRLKKMVDTSNEVVNEGDSNSENSDENGANTESNDDTQNDDENTNSLENVNE